MKNRIAKKILLFERFAANDDSPTFELATKRTIRQFLRLRTNDIINRFMPNEASKKRLMYLLKQFKWNGHDAILPYLLTIMNNLNIADMRNKIQTAIKYNDGQIREFIQQIKNIYIVLEARPKIDNDMKNNVSEQQIISNYFTAQSPLSLFISSTAVREPAPEGMVYEPNQTYSNNSTDIYSLFHEDANSELSDNLYISIPNTIAQSLTPGDQAAYRLYMSIMLDGDPKLTAEKNEINRLPKDDPTRDERIIKWKEKRNALSTQINAALEAARLDNNFNSVNELNRLKTTEKRKFLTLIRNAARPVKFEEIDQNAIAEIMYKRLFDNNEFYHDITDEINTYFLRYGDNRTDDVSDIKNEAHIKQFVKKISNQYKPFFDKEFMNILETGYITIFNNYKYIEKESKKVRAKDKDKIAFAEIQQKYKLTLYSIIRKTNIKLINYMHAECNKQLKDYENDTYVDNEGKRPFKEFKERQAYIIPVVREFIKNENIPKFIYDICHTDMKIEELPTKNDPLKTRKTKIYSINDNIVNFTLAKSSSGKYFYSKPKIEKTIKDFLDRYDQEKINAYFKKYSQYPVADGEDIPQDVYDTYYNAIKLNIRNKMMAKIIETAKKVSHILNEQLSSAARKQLNEIKDKKEQLKKEMESLQEIVEHWNSPEFIEHEYKRHPEKYDYDEYLKIKDELERKQQEYEALDEDYSSKQRTYKRNSGDTQELFDKAQAAEAKKQELKTLLDNKAITKKEYNKRLQKILDAEHIMNGEIETQDGIIDTNGDMQELDTGINMKLNSQSDTSHITEDEQVHEQQAKTREDEIEEQMPKLVAQYLKQQQEVEAYAKEIQNMNGDSKFKARYERRLDSKKKKLQQLGDNIENLTTLTLAEALEYYAPANGSIKPTSNTNDDILVEFQNELKNNDQELIQSGRGSDVNYDENITELPETEDDELNDLVKLWD